MNQENFEEAYIRSNAQLAFVIDEGNKANKAKKNAYIRSRGGRDNAPQGVYSDQEVYADNPHGSEGSMRGVRRRGAKPSKDEINTHRLGLKRKLQAKHKERQMNQEKLKEAYIRANAHLAFVIAESTLVTKVQGISGRPGYSVAKPNRKTGKDRIRLVPDERGERVLAAARRRSGSRETTTDKGSTIVKVPERNRRS